MLKESITKTVVLTKTQKCSTLKIHSQYNNWSHKANEAFKYNTMPHHNYCTNRD